MANPQVNPADAPHSEPMAPTDMANGSGLEGHAAVPGGAEHVEAPTALGFNDTGWVGIAALVVLIGMLVLKVPATIAAMLDKQIGDIRRQLDEAKQLRSEAEALRDEYAAKARSAEADAAAMREHAHHEAAAIVAKAKADTEALMDRRARMAEDKIQAAERQALAEVRATTAQAAAVAAAAILAERLDANADRALVDRAIAGVGRLN